MRLGSVRSQIMPPPQPTALLHISDLSIYRNSCRKNEEELLQSETIN